MLRKTTSLTSLFSFAALFATSVVLYFEPHGRVAYWSNWTFLGLGKNDWDAMHLASGVLFVIFSLAHIWLNWRPITAYLKDRTRRLVVFTPAMCLGLGLTAFFCLAAVRGWPPVSQILEFNEYLKDLQAAVHGNPPYGHAELSTLKAYCGYLDLDPALALDALIKAGLRVDSDGSTILAIARANAATPQNIHEIVTLALRPDDPFAALPPRPPEGTGRMRLADFCAQHGLPLDKVLDRLSAAGIRAEAGMRLKDLAAAHGVEPAKIYALIRSKAGG